MFMYVYIFLYTYIYIRNEEKSGPAFNRHHARYSFIVAPRIKSQFVQAKTEFRDACKKCVVNDKERRLFDIMR